MLSAQPGVFLGLFTVFHHLSQALSSHTRAAPLVSRLLSSGCQCGPGCCSSAPGCLALRSPQSPPACTRPPRATHVPYPGALVNRTVNSEANFSLNSPRPPGLQPGGSCSFPGADIRQDLLILLC